MLKSFQKDALVDTRAARNAVAIEGDPRRFLEERLDAMSRRLQATKDCGECEAPSHTFEEVREMIHADLEESRIRREENEKRAAERRWQHRYAASRLST